MLIKTKFLYSIFEKTFKNNFFYEIVELPQNLKKV